MPAPYGMSDLGLDPPPLPWPEDALRPWISSETVATHYHDHHVRYCERVRELLPDASAYRTLGEVIRQTSVTSGPLHVAAVQAWNHAFYWASLAPGGQAGPPPGSALDDEMRRQGLSPGDVARHLVSLGSAFSGSGWLWLVHDPRPSHAAGRTIYPVTTWIAGQTATRPPAHLRPLAVIDLWEHAWYLDRKSDKRGHLEDVASRLLDWESAALRFEEGR